MKNMSILNFFLVFCFLMTMLVSSINLSNSKVIITWHIMWEILFRWMQRKRLSSFETLSAHNPCFFRLDLKRSLSWEWKSNRLNPQFLFSDLNYSVRNELWIISPVFFRFSQFLSLPRWIYFIQPGSNPPAAFFNSSLA